MEHACIREPRPHGALYRWRFDEHGRSLQLDVVGPVTLDKASLGCIAVLDGVAVDYSMKVEVRDEITTGRLVRALQDWTPPLAPLCLIIQAGRTLRSVPQW